MKKTFRSYRKKLNYTNNTYKLINISSSLTLDRHQWLLPISGFIIGLVLMVITGLSDSLATHQPVEEQPIGAYVALMMIAGGIYFAGALHCRKISDSAALRNWIVLIALGLRLTMAYGTPILEDDHYRYLWDGALVAHGHNPYRHPPGDVLAKINQNNPSPLVHLAKQSGIILERINYPWLRTIYPPVAQAAFGLAHWLSPWRLWGCRMVLTIFELAALFILCRMGVHASGLLIYGWNPLLIKEIYNSCHVDALMLPFLLLTVIAVQRNRPITATATIGLATGIKLWPVLLMPMVWRRLTKRPKVLIASLMLFTVFFTGAIFPMVLTGLDGNSGLAAYSRQWEMNDALFTLVSWCIHHITAFLPFNQAWSALMPRLVTAAAVLGGVFLLAWRNTMIIEKQFLMAASLLFIFSPTQFPWYYIWLIPFLALYAHPALILYTALLPLYYLRPLMVFNGQTALFDNGIVWIEHGPVLIWLIWRWIMGSKQFEQSTSAVQ